VPGLGTFSPGVAAPLAGSQARRTPRRSVARRAAR
jgi:hypothetical protein